MPVLYYVLFHLYIILFTSQTTDDDDSILQMKKQAEKGQEGCPTSLTE